MSVCRRALSFACASVFGAKCSTPKKQWRQQAKKRENSTVSQNTQQADSNVRVEKEKERVPLKRMTQTGDAAARAAASEPTIPDLDADCTPPLNNEDSCILLDALKSARKQEQRLAQECQRDDSDSDPAAIPSGQEKATAKGKRTQGRVPDPGTTQKTGDYSRKDRMHSKPSAHVPKAITTELFGSKTGDFEALGIQKVWSACFSSALYILLLCKFAVQCCCRAANPSDVVRAAKYLHVE